MKKLTPKQQVLRHYPQAILDYYESMRGRGIPCWFIRPSIQGFPPIGGICASPRAAWKDCATRVLEAL